MPLNWMKENKLEINHLLLLEKIQIKWLFDYISDNEIAAILKANPIIQWYFENKCPEISQKLKALLEKNKTELSSQDIRKLELSVLNKIQDWIVYATDPDRYDKMAFLKWDSNELLSLNEYEGKTILDIGSGTGRLGFAVAEFAKYVFCIEPVGNLRDYLRAKALSKKLTNVYAIDGLITSIPLPDNFSDITLSGHVFGDELDNEYKELMRVTKTKGMIILCPGNNDNDNEIHSFLIENGFTWSKFEEPNDGIKRKYWKEKQ